MRSLWVLSLLVSLGSQAWGAPPRPPLAVLLSPKGRTHDTTPAYGWTAVPGATEYLVWVDGPTGRVFSQWYAASELCSGEVCSVEPRIELSEGAYGWWVEPAGPELPSTWSAKGSFRVGQAAGPPRTATPVSPGGKTSSTSPTYRWNAIRRATAYHVWVAGASGVVFDQWFAASEVCDESSCTVLPPVVLSEGPYAWWVQGQNAAGVGRWSAEKAFVVAGAVEEAAPSSPPTR